MATTKTKRAARPAFVERNDVFDPSRDNSSVDQFGFVNLREVFEKGIVPSNLNEEKRDFNGVTAPASILPRCSDVFDSVRKADYVRRTLDALDLADTERQAAEEAAARAVESSGAPQS